MSSVHFDVVVRGKHSDAAWITGMLLSRLLALQPKFHYRIRPDTVDRWRLTVLQSLYGMLFSTSCFSKHHKTAVTCVSKNALDIVQLCHKLYSPC